MQHDETFDDGEMGRLWLDEAEARCRQIDAGEIELIPADVVLESLRNRQRFLEAIASGVDDADAGRVMETTELKNRMQDHRKLRS